MTSNANLSTGRKKSLKFLKLFLWPTQRIKFPFPANRKHTNEKKLRALPYTNEVMLSMQARCALGYLSFGLQPKAPKD